MPSTVVADEMHGSPFACFVCCGGGRDTDHPLLCPNYREFEQAFIDMSDLFDAECFVGNCLCAGAARQDLQCIE